MKHNPLFRGKHMCDPHVMVAGGRAYLSVGADAGQDSDTWSIPRWEIYASDDLLHWKKQCEILPERLYMGKSDCCWASDLAYKNGYFYFYFSDRDRSVGVLRSRDCKAFEDVLRRPLLPEGFCDTLSYDPTVFTDDDGRSYLLFGCEYRGHYHIVPLGEDMISLAGAPRRLCVTGLTLPDDKSYLHKHGGRYYLTSGSFYAVSDALFGEYVCKGSFRVSRDHGSFFDFQGQNYYAFTIFDPTVFCRTTGLTYVQYLRDGSIVTDGLINEYGVGYYDAAWNGIECEWYRTGVNVEKTDNFWNRIDVCVNSSSELYFPNIVHADRFDALSFYGVSERGLTVFVREGGRDGRLLGTVRLRAAQGGSVGCYYTRAVGAMDFSGVKDVCLTFDGEGKIDFFKFFRTESARGRR